MTSHQEVKKYMSKDQTIGALILIICALVAVSFIALLFFYDPHIASFLNLGAAADVQFWLIAAPVTIAFIGIMGIGAWIGWTMATTPPPKPIEDVTTETETP
jgi:predicted DNA-binding transcriptional regulator